MAVVEVVDGVTPEELIQRARALAPMVRERAEEAERNRVVAPEIIAEMKRNDLFRIFKPKRFGGFEFDVMTGIRCSLAFAAADTSTSWVFGLGVIHNWLIAMFPLQCQEDIWGENPEAFTAGSYAPAGTCERAPGGYRITGTWHYASGCDHADWGLMGVFFPADEEGGKPSPGFVIAPRSDFTIDDTWHTMGLSATGSRSFVCDNVFIPEHRRITFAELSSGNSPGYQVHQTPLYRYPLLSLIAYYISTPAIGALQCALDGFIEDAKARTTRGAVVLGGAKMVDFQAVQMRVGEAAAALKAANAMLFDQLEESHRTVVDFLMIRRPPRSTPHCTLFPYTIQLAIQGLEALWGAAGGAGIQLSQPVQRAWRDAHAVAHHVSFNWDALSSMYGQMLLGLEPQGQY
jgi:alkylation response protein AidB-like acyl-CoA dehydrogenase